MMPGQEGVHSMPSTILWIAIHALLCAAIVHAQATRGDTITVSERVGCVIDSVERARFGLFPRVNGFRSAVFLRLPDSTYVLRTTAVDSARMTKVVKEYPQPNWKIGQWTETIDHYEGIQAGTYRMTAKAPVPPRNPEPPKWLDRVEWGDTPEVSFSFRGRPLEGCRGFFIYEMGYFPKLGERFESVGHDRAIWHWKSVEWSMWPAATLQGRHFSSRQRTEQVSKDDIATGCTLP
jgi:hypothetical protein